MTSTAVHLMGPFVGTEILDRHLHVASLIQQVQDTHTHADSASVASCFEDMNDHQMEYLRHYCPYLFKCIEACNGDQLLVCIRQMFSVDPDSGAACSDDALVPIKMANKWPFYLTQHFFGAHYGGACIPDPTDVIILSLPGLETHPLQDMYFRRCDGLYSNALRHVLKKGASHRPYMSQQPVLALRAHGHREWQAYRSLLLPKEPIPIYITNGTVVKFFKGTLYPLPGTIKHVDVSTEDTRGSFYRWNAGPPATRVALDVSDGEFGVTQAIAIDEAANRARMAALALHGDEAITGFVFDHEPSDWREQ